MTTVQGIDIHQFGALNVEGAQGISHAVVSFWEQQRAAIIFVRHFGWIFCRQQVAELVDYQQEFTARNADLIIIGNGKPQDLPGFAEQTGYSGKLFTDPSLETFRALGFSRKISGLLAVNAFTSGFKALKDGIRPGSMQGDALQLGGAVVVGPGDKIFYYYKGKQAADHAPVEEILAGCTSDRVAP